MHPRRLQPAGPGFDLDDLTKIFARALSGQESESLGHRSRCHTSSRLLRMEQASQLIQCKNVASSCSPDDLRLGSGSSLGECVMLNPAYMAFARDKTRRARWWYKRAVHDALRCGCSVFQGTWYGIGACNPARAHCFEFANHGLQRHPSHRPSLRPAAFACMAVKQVYRG